VRTWVTGLWLCARTLDEAVAGDNIGVLLRGVEKDEIERGMVLAKPGSIHPHLKVQAEVSVLAQEATGRGVVLGKPGSISPPLKSRGEVYVLTKEEGGRHTPFFTGYRPQF